MYTDFSNQVAGMALDIYELKIIHSAYQDITKMDQENNVNLFGFLILAFARILPFLVQEEMDRFKILREVDRFKTATSHAIHVSEKYTKHLWYKRCRNKCYNFWQKIVEFTWDCLLNVQNLLGHPVFTYHLQLDRLCLLGW